MPETVNENMLPPPFQPVQPVMKPAQQVVVPTQPDALAAALPPAWDPNSTNARAVPVIQLSREDLILRTFFNDNVIGPKLRPYLNTSMFLDPVNQALVKVINKFDKKHKRSPSAQELILGMGSTGFSEQLVQKLGYICNTPMVGVRQDYLIEILEGYFRERMTENILINAAENVHDRHVDGINSLLPRLKEAVNFSLHTNLGLNVYSDIGTALALLKERKECIPSAINEIRAKTGIIQADGTIKCGGYYRKTLTLYVGQPNVGKSLILGNEAGFAYSCGYNVLYISLELAEDYLWQRLAANLCDVTMPEILQMTEEECRAKLDAKLLANQGDGIHGNLQVKRLKTTTTPADIEMYVDQFEATYGKLDLLVIDYIGIMKPGLSAAEQRSMYLDGVAKAEQIRDFLIERNIAGISAVQFNRLGYNSLDAGIEAVQGSSGYTETADVMISIKSDSVLRECGMFYHEFMKNRFGRNSDIFQTRCDFMRMKWFDATQEELTHYQELRTESDAVMANQMMSRGPRPPKRGAAPPPPPKAQQSAPQEQLPSRPGERVASMI